jgi:hypothetical protein
VMPPVTTTEPVNFRWNGQVLLITGPTGQLVISPERALELLVLLYSHKDDLFQAAQDLPLPDWAHDELSTAETPPEVDKMPPLLPGDDNKTAR